MFRAEAYSSTAGCALERVAGTKRKSWQNDPAMTMILAGNRAEKIYRYHHIQNMIKSKREIHEGCCN